MTFWVYFVGFWELMLFFICKLPTSISLSWSRIEVANAGNALTGWGALLSCLPFFSDVGGTQHIWGQKRVVTNLWKSWASWVNIYWIMIEADMEYQFRTWHLYISSPESKIILTMRERGHWTKASWGLEYILLVLLSQLSLIQHLNTEWKL